MHRNVLYMLFNVVIIPEEVSPKDETRRKNSTKSYNRKKFSIVLCTSLP